MMPGLRAEIVNRVVLGNKIIGHERLGRSRYSD
jgi:hypothetical protein